MKTQIGIIGAGPAGLTLALWLKKEGISSVIIEARSRAYIEARVRAGLLEQNTVDILTDLGLADRLIKEGQVHHGVFFNFDGERIRVPFGELTGGRNISIYGQQEVVKDLTEAWLAGGGEIYFESPALAIQGIDTENPSILFDHQGIQKQLDCDFVAACDGFHGIGRKSMPQNSYKEFSVTYPYSWLGILARVAPSAPELIYAYHENGFALSSMRSEEVSRLYVQCEVDDTVENWSDDRIWEELSIRLGTPGWELKRGPIFEKSITPMRSYFIDNMQAGTLFLAGDAAHIVPPTGGKGLNLAVADVKHLVDGWKAYYQQGTKNVLEAYSKQALKRIWRAQDFSNFMTTFFHKQDAHGSFTYQLQKAKFDYIKCSKAYATTIAENYVGLPFESFE